MLYFPHADDSNIFQNAVYCASIEVAYNYDYDNSPQPKGFYPTSGPRTVIGEPGTRYDLSTEESIINMNPIKVKRDESVGVSRSAAFQVTTTNFTSQAMGQVPIAGAWMTVEAGFPEADEWALVATGKIRKATMNTEGQVTFECYDPIKDIIDGTLQRWLRFDTVSTASPIQTQAIADGSSSYNNSNAGAGVTGITSSAAETRYKIKFDTVNTFKVYNEYDDALGGSYSIASDATVTHGGNTYFVIQSEGWTQDTAGPTYHYAIDDEFYFDVALGRHQLNLQPVHLIKELITSDLFMNLWIYDVYNGAPYDSVFYDEANWDAIEDDYNSYVIRGQFDAGTPIMDVIKQLLRVINGSIYTMPNGQIALFAARPIGGEALVLNGDPSNGQVDILSGSAVDDGREMYNIVELEYIDPNTDELTVSARKSYSSPLRTDRILKLDCSGLELPSAMVNAALDLAIRRVSRPPRRYTMRTTLKGMGIDMLTPVQIIEPFVNANITALTIEKTLDVMANEVEVTTTIDDYLMGDYAVVTERSDDPQASFVDPDAGPFTKKVF